MADRYNSPDKGTRDWHRPLNENFSDLGIEVQNEVPTWSDLPSPTGETSSNGQPRVYRVDADNIFVKDTGIGWSIIGGRGSSDHPLPSVHTERAQYTERLTPDYSDHNPLPRRAPEWNGANYWENHPDADGPVIDESFVPDSNVKGVADGLWLTEGKYVYIFFEARYTDQSPILHVGRTTDIFDQSAYEYLGELLPHDERQSHPLVFKRWGQYYHVPSQNGNPPVGGTGLNIWTLDHNTLAEGVTSGYWTHQEQAIAPESGEVNEWTDPIVWHDGTRYWALNSDKFNENLEFWYADPGQDLVGRTWTAHPDNPIDDLSTGLISKASGRARVFDDYVDFYVQSTRNSHNSGMDKIRFTTLTTDTAEFDVLSKHQVITRDYNQLSKRTQDAHTLDPMIPPNGSRPVALTDNKDSNSNWELAVYGQTDSPTFACRITRSSNWTPTADGSFQDVPFDKVVSQERMDYESNNVRLYVPKTGYYWVTARVTIDAQEAANSRLKLLTGTTADVTESRVRGKQPVPSAGEVTVEATDRVYGTSNDRFVIPKIALDSSTNPPLVTDSDNTVFSVVYDGY